MTHGATPVLRLLRYSANPEQKKNKELPNAPPVDRNCSWGGYKGPMCELVINITARKRIGERICFDCSAFIIFLCQGISA